MARLSKASVHAALDIAAAHLLDSRGDDHFISRKDVRLKLTTLSGSEKALTALFYRFVDHRDNQPGARVTKTDLEATLAYAKEKLIDAYDINNNGLSNAEIEKMSATAKAAVQLAREQKASTGLDALLTTLCEMGEGLLFFGHGSEHDPTLRCFHQPAQLDRITRASFRTALNLDPVNPAEAIFFFQQGRQEYGWLFEQYEYYEAWEALAKFRRLEQFMVTTLRDVTHIIVGTDGTRSSSEYPTYFVGLAPDGSIVGFETEMVWT